jgi:predicted PilT family ATPase
LERSNTNFFEGFTILLHPIVKRETDTHGGKRELERLAKFAAIGRIRLEEIQEAGKLEGLNNLESDEKIMESAFKFNAILITGDKAMMVFAQAKSLFCLYV